MNLVALVGNICSDPDIRYSQEKNSCVARFNVAVSRRYKTEGGPDADFISCIAFGKTGEFIEKYFSKGMRVGLNGHIQTGSYTNKDGQKVYTTNVIADSVEFVERKSSGSEDTSSKHSRNDSDGFMHIPDGFDEEGLPF